MPGARGIGLLGGTFDPIHLGHLIIAQEALFQLSLERVLFIPTGQPWLKANQRVSPADHRIAMVELALEGASQFQLCRVEVDREGPSYTVDTLQALRSSYGPQMGLFFVVGRDSLAQFSRWRRPAEILGLCTLVVVPRPGGPGVEPRVVVEGLCPGAGQRVVELQVPLVGISGTEIRRRVARGLPIRYWVPEKVEAYIYEHGLYQEG